MLDGGPARVAGRDDGRTGRGLLLTCLWYIREVDPQTLLLTGLTRDGIYLVENGEVTAAVNNFRFNESPVSMLARLAEVGSHRAGLVPRVGRLLHPYRHAAGPGGRLQHVVGEPGQLAGDTVRPGRKPGPQVSSSRNPTFMSTW